MQSPNPQDNMIDLMKAQPIFMEISINPVGLEQSGLWIKELTRPLKVTVNLESTDNETIIRQLYALLKHQHQVKLAHAVNKIHARLTDSYILDE